MDQQLLKRAAKIVLFIRKHDFFETIVENTGYPESIVKYN